MDEACYALAIAIGGFFVYNRFREVQCERFENKITTRKYTLKELCELLQTVKNTLQKDGDTYNLIDVRRVEFTMTGASVVFTAFNRAKWTTKLYKGYVSRGGSSADITDNMVSFDESYVENKAFGKNMGMHDSEALGTVSFMNSDVANLSRYTFTREALAPTGGEDIKVVGMSDSIPMKLKTSTPPLPGTERSKTDLVTATTALNDHHIAQRTEKPTQTKQRKTPGAQQGASGAQQGVSGAQQGVSGAQQGASLGGASFGGVSFGGVSDAQQGASIDEVLGERQGSFSGFGF